MIVGYLSSGKDAAKIWIGGSTDPNTFEPNTILKVDMPSTMQYMNHVMINGARVNSPGLQYNSIAIWDGDSNTWITATP
ncbi:MAG: hypothetical protein AAGI07_17230 [Bacteroidota bacterium]